MRSLTVLVRGCGDVGSAVAHRLRALGHRVVMHDVPAPAHTRRGMAFTDALFDGRAWLAGMLAKHVAPGASLAAMLQCGRAIPLVCDPWETLATAVAPEVIVDARMRKRVAPERLRGSAGLTIGLGPNFVAGDTVDLAVETAWGERLGAVVQAGATLPLAGEPKPIAGHARDRYVYAPVAGTFRTARRIGDRVGAGEVVASIDGHAVAAPLDGCLRGLTHDGVPLVAGTKVLEVDPRTSSAGVFGLGERPVAVAEGVGRAIATWQAGGA